MTTAASPNERERRIAEILARLPAGTVQAGLLSLQHGLDIVDQAAADAPSTAAVVDHLVAPVRLVDDWPDPTDPLPAAGGGAVHADLIDDDRDALARLRSARPMLDAEALAAEAQQWRLPVTPYRPLPISPPSPNGQTTDDDHTHRRHSIKGRVVIDLSALWAGPLATSILAEVGVQVVKLDPQCRPDAFGEHPALYARLNGRKEIIDLDLRDADHRHQFESLLASADLVVDSFSRRVMPNLGYAPDQLRSLNPTVATLSLVAFPTGSPEQDWVAYGPGVHATIGLGSANVNLTDQRFQPAPIAYPDVLAGLAAFAAAAELLTTPGPSPHREISLAAAVQPLVERAVAKHATAEAKTDADYKIGTGTGATGRWG